MNARMPWSTIVVATLFLATAGIAEAAEEKTPPEASAGPVGRFQLIMSFDARVFMLDTTTGRVWSRSPNQEWRFEGNPTLAADKPIVRSAGKPAAKGGVAGQAPKLPPTILLLDAPSIELTVGQRETEAIPGSEGTVLIRLGDVTDGQVLVSIVTMDDKPLLARTSIATGESAIFSVDKRTFVIKLERLRNALIGHDFATFSISESSDKSDSAKAAGATKDPARKKEAGEKKDAGEKKAPTVR